MNISKKVRSRQDMFCLTCFCSELVFPIFKEIPRKITKFHEAIDFFKRNELNPWENYLLWPDKTCSICHMFFASPAQKLIEYLFQKKLSQDLFLNVNFPGYMTVSMFVVLTWIFSQPSSLWYFMPWHLLWLTLRWNR